MRDVYLLLGDLPEEPADRDTADGQPATGAAAQRRLGRMVAADERQFDERDAAALASAAAAAQAEQLAAGIRAVAARVAGEFDAVILSGHGEFLARRALARGGRDAAAGIVERPVGTGALPVRPGVCVGGAGGRRWQRA